MRRRVAHAALACLLIAPSPALAILRVKSDRAGLATGFYLLEYSTIRGLSRTQIISTLAQIGPLAVGRRLRLLPQFQYYLFAECNGRPIVRPPYRPIPSTSGEVELQCPPR